MSVSIAGKTTKPGSSVSQDSEVLYLRTVYAMGSLHQTDAARFRGGDIMLPVSQTRLDYLSATDPFAAHPVLIHVHAHGPSIYLVKTGGT